jgi:hypothetical protein
MEKIFFRTSWPISIKLGTNHRWVKRIKFVQKKGQLLFQGEIITEMHKWSGIIKKSSSQEPLSQKSSYLHESFLI